ncbi:ribosomal protein S10, partial [Piedraia hortae CBS 480.64]
SEIRLPRAIQATYLDPLRRRPEGYHTLPVTCDLQIRSYSVRNLEVYSDFAMRAAYYLNLVAIGPLPLPKLRTLTTVIRGPFVHKKSQENFERITRRRRIEIRGGHPDAVAAWLAFVKKHRYYGIGMKANVFEYSGLDVGKDMDAESVRISERLGDE